MKGCSVTELVVVPPVGGRDVCGKSGANEKAKVAAGSAERVSVDYRGDYLLVRGDGSGVRV
jgi:hypothetical protein